MIAVAGKNVVVTGVIAGESRATAENRLRDAGAFVHPRVTSKVDVLVTGERVGQTKLNDAAKHGVVVVPWDQIAWDAASDDGEVEESQPAAPALETFRQIGPMLAQTGPLPPSNGDWSFELKWDGYRCVATVRGGKVAMQSRSALTEYSAQFPKIAAELALLPDCVIDGELVVLPAAIAEGGETASQALQRGATAGSFKAIAGGNDAGGTAKFIVFDVLDVLGNDVRAEPLSRRREYLPELLKGRTLIGVCPVFDDGEALFDYCVEHGLEGVVAKRNDSRYMDGARNPAWTKVKARCRQEFAVVGYTAGKGKRAGTAGALLLAVADDDGEYVYCGSVGTGGTYDDYKAIVDSLSPLTPGLTSARHDLSRAELSRTTWVDAEVVVEVEFQRWTEDGHLFHPSMQGVRSDKSAADVVREPCGKGGTQ